MSPPFLHKSCKKPDPDTGTPLVFILAVLLHVALFEGGTEHMCIPKRKLMTALAAVAVIASASGQAMAQEGVLHQLLRSAIAIPEAVLRSLHGPVKTGKDSQNDMPAIRYPYPVQANYGQSYGYAVPPDVLIHNSPGYVTYNVIEEKTDFRTQEQADTHVYNPIPFEK